VNLDELRAQVTDNDREIVEAINKRLELVAQIKRYKAENGIAFVDPGRGSSAAAPRATPPRGPLSDEGLERILEELLDLSKRETA